jgi:hypothetical protein
MINSTTFHYVPSSTKLISKVSDELDEYDDDLNAIINADYNSNGTRPLNKRMSISNGGVNYRASDIDTTPQRPARNSPARTNGLYKDAIELIEQKTNNAKSALQRRLRTNSFNKDASPSTLRNGHADEDTDDKKPGHHEANDLKTTFIRMLSGESTHKQKLSSSNHTETVQPQQRRSNSIKIKKPSEEKEELLFKFKKKRSISHSYPNRSHHHDRTESEDNNEDSDESANSDEDENSDESDEIKSTHKMADPLLEVASALARTGFNNYSKSFGEPVQHHPLYLIQNEKSCENVNTVSSLRSSKALLASSDNTSSGSSSSPGSTTLPIAMAMLESTNKRDENNNSNSGGVVTMTMNTAKFNKNLTATDHTDSMNIVILDVNGPAAKSTSSANVALLNPSNMKTRRTDSIRMRHPSNMNLNGAYGSEKSLNERYGNRKRDRLMRLFKKSRTSESSDDLNGGRRQKYFIIFIMFVVNLLNYIDRFTLAGTNNFISRLNVRFSIQKISHNKPL